MTFEALRSSKPGSRFGCNIVDDPTLVGMQCFGAQTGTGLHRMGVHLVQVKFLDRTKLHQCWRLLFFQKPKLVAAVATHTVGIAVAVTVLAWMAQVAHSKQLSENTARSSHSSRQFKNLSTRIPATMPALPPRRNSPWPQSPDS